MTDTDATNRRPGWYRDPGDSARLAYWDGRRWTGQQRPHPSWQGGDPADDAAAEREARRRLAHGPRVWVLMGAVFLVIVGLAWVTLPKAGSAGPKVLTDEAFITAANKECRATIPTLRPLIDTRDTTVDGPKIAGDVERVATGLGGLAVRLRALPVATADQAYVSGWLDSWDRYATIGHDYANALRNNDLRRQIALSKDGDAVQKVTDRFARANDLGSCMFFIAPRGTGSDPFSGGG